MTQDNTRRSFLRQGLAGACLFGMGAAVTAGGMRLFGRPAGSGHKPAAASAGSVSATPLGELEQDLAELRKTDPALVKFRETGRFDTGYRRAMALARTGDDGWAVGGDRTVRLFAPDGTPRGELACPDTPRAIAPGDGGRLYVATKDQVLTFKAGKLAATWAAPQPAALFTSLAMLAGDLYVADARQRMVVRFDPAGKALGQVGKKDPGRNLPGFILPSPYFDLAVSGREGDLFLWATNSGMHEVQAYTPDGDKHRAWGVAGPAIGAFCGCCNPTHLAILPDGRFVTSEKGIARVKVYRTDGAFDGVVAGAEAFATSVTGLDLATDARGRVLVLDPASRAVRVFEPLA